MKVKVTIEAEIPDPILGEQYCDWGIGGRSGFSCSNIKKITKKNITIYQRSPVISFDKPNKKDIVEKISMDAYILKHIYHHDIKKKIDIKIMNKKGD